MSRTEGVSLPRLPRLHTRVTSPGAIRPHQASSTGRKWEKKAHRRAISEPNYTAYLGTPRQDVPGEVYRDAAMFDEVFDKKGALLLSRNTPKIISPLNSLGYSSLHDPHCQKLFLNNKKLRLHLVNMGLVTNDLKVVASTAEQRQKIRAHELLERREQLIQKLEEQEEHRLERLQRQMKLPQLYRESIVKEERRRLRAEEIQQLKTERFIQSEAVKKQRELKMREERQKKLKAAVEMARLRDQARRNSARARQEVAEMMAYEKQYGEFGRQLALWHRESDEIHNRMVVMERKYWARMRHIQQQRRLAESTSRRSSASSDSVVDVESVHELLPSADKPSPPPGPEADRDTELRAVSESQHEEDTTTQTTQDIGEDKEKERETERGGVDEATRAAEEHEDDVSSPSEETVAKEDKDREDQASEAGRGEEALQDQEEERKDDGQLASEGSDVLPSQGESVIRLDREESNVELTKILLEALRRDRDVDANLGYLQLDEFIQVLNSRDLGFQLSEGELLYIAEQMDINVNGWIPLVQVVPQLPQLLMAIYQHRAEQAMQHYGSYLEEQWCQLYLPDGEVAYFNKLTGVLQYGGRPDDFRPNLKDEAFEESIVDFFETADTNKDGVLDYNDFYALLVSPMVSTRVYSNQIEELLQLFESYCTEGLMTLDQFAYLAKMLLIMIYQNAYPDVEDWIELQTRKYGTVLFNKQNGEVALASTTEHGEAATTDAVVSEMGRDVGTDRDKEHTTTHQYQADDEASRDGGDETPQPALRKRKKHTRRVSWSDDPTPTSNTATPTGTTTATPTGTTTATQEPSNSRPTSQTSAPPPLRRRRSKSQEKSRSAATESVDSTRETEKEESKTATDAKGSEGTKDLIIKETIPIPGKVESDSIPGVEVNAATASGDNKPGDSEQPTQPVTVDQSPDPSSTLSAETDKRETFEAHSDPIPGDASTTEANKPSDGDRESNKKLNQASEGEQTVHEG